MFKVLILNKQVLLEFLKEGIIVQWFFWICKLLVLIIFITKLQSLVPLSLYQVFDIQVSSNLQRLMSGTLYFVQRGRYIVLILCFCCLVRWPSCSYQSSLLLPFFLSKAFCTKQMYLVLLDLGIELMTSRKQNQNLSTLAKNVQIKISIVKL